MRKGSGQEEAVPLNYLKKIAKLSLKRQLIFIAHKGYYFICSQGGMLMSVITVSSGKHPAKKRRNTRKKQNKKQTEGLIIYLTFSSPNCH